MSLDHLLSSRRHHLLDLRGVDPLSPYRHGYLDPCEVFRLAGWASLMRWHRESAARRADRADQQLYHEALELVQYWTVTRVMREMKSDELRAAVDAIPTTLDNQTSYEAASDIWLSYFHESEQLEETMWMRLAALRPFLWD